MTVKPTLDETLSGLAAAGAWTVEHAHELEPLVEAASDKRRPGRRVLIDVGRVDQLDTFGAWLIERLTRACRNAGLDTAIAGLPDNYRGLLKEMHDVNLRPQQAPPRFARMSSVVENLGRAVVGTASDLLRIVDMLGETAVALLRVLVRPTTFRFTSFVHHIDRVGLQAVPIILLITFLLGCIIAQQGIFHFRRFGAELYVVDMIGILVLREVGVIMVSVMVAGRSGSAYTAELGSMKMREEIDALRSPWAPIRSRSSFCRASLRSCARCRFLHFSAS